jgi:SAM-dependent methyltransferase
MSGRPWQSDEMKVVQRIVDQHAPGNRPREVLEAGCGSLSHLILAGDHLTGIDVSEQQLERNAALAVKIHGDIESYPLPEGAFDLVISWDVLEHLPGPERALENLARTLRPGGLLVLAFPNRDSVKGLATRLTPHGFHVWAYRRLWGVERAGEGDRAPFRTFLRPAIAVPAIRRFAREHGLEIVHEHLYESLMQIRLRKRHPVANVAFAVIGALGRLVSGGRRDPTHSDVIFILKRPPT